MRPCIQSVWHHTRPAVVSTNITDLPSFCFVSIFRLHSYVVIMGIYNFASFFFSQCFPAHTLPCLIYFFVVACHWKNAP